MPVVTITRQFGSGGSEVAERVARALGWPLLDNELVQSVALRLGTSIGAVEAREERIASLSQRLADVLAFGSPEALPLVAEAADLPPSEERVLEMTRRVIDEAVARGSAVFVGRGAQCLLAERTDAVHAFCYAPRESLVTRVRDRERISDRDAERRVDEINRQREQYVERHWGRAWSAPEHYHLWLNTAWLGIDVAASLIVQACRVQFEGSQSGG